MAENENIENKEETKEVTVEELQSQIAKLTEENNKFKRDLSKTNSESADYKRQLRALQSESERAAAEKAEADKVRDEENQKLKREVTVLTRRSQYIGMGYDADLAAAIADAYGDNDIDKVIAFQAEHEKRREQKITEKLLSSQPSLSSGKTPDAKDLEAAEKAKMRKWAGLI